MARKPATALVSQQTIIEDALENFKIVSEVKYDLAKAAYDAQTPATQEVVDVLQQTLRVHAHDYINVVVDPPRGVLVPVKIERKYVDWNLLYIVMDALKNLALFDIRVAEYKFPPSLCTKCEAEIEVRETKTRRKHV